MKQHILVLEDATHRRTIVLENHQYTIGRHSQMDIRLNSRQASRHHATLMRKVNSKTQEECFWIIDGDLEGHKSQNGVFVNGEKRLVHELKNGDLINFGCSINASYHLSGGSFEASAPMEISWKQMPENEVVAASSVGALESAEERTGGTRSEDDTFHEQSYLDTVTDLPNQALFLEYLNIAISNARRSQTQVGLLLCQIANWTDLKRKRGDGLANMVLQDLGKKLKSGLRNGDIVSRWDTDQFILLLSKVQDQESLAGIARRLMKPLGEPLTSGHYVFEPELCSGTILYPVEGESVELLLVKLQKRLQPVVFEPTETPLTSPPPPIHNAFTTALDERLEGSNSTGLSEVDLKRLAIVEQRLERALEQHELELYYQPQINWSLKTVEAMEAFIRWQHPQKGLLPPRQFLPWSDQTEFLVPLTQWILKTACTQNQMWQNHADVPFLVSVNISEKQFYHPQFKDLVLSALSLSGLQPEYLELELRESTIIRDVAAAKTIIGVLHGGGVRFSLDDFGTDYVALRYLQELPFHKIKIDRSLTEKLITEPENTANIAMIKTLVALGQGFGLQVVAEGIEQKKQIDFFVEIGCPLMQGFCFSEPLNILGANSFLKKYNTGGLEKGLASREELDEEPDNG